jgi:IS605 OrfB family transposase
VDKEHRTYQCRIAVGAEESALLSSYAAIYGTAERTLFARLSAGGNLTDLKREFIIKFGITARQFNAVAAGVKGKILSVKEHRAVLINDAERRVAKAKKVLSIISDPGKRHQKKRRLATLESRLRRMKADHDTGIIRLCFGSRKLFLSQFDLAGNGYPSLDAWRQDWQDSRKAQFFAIGSKDETAGCQTCVATVSEDGSISLRLRLPNTLPDKYISTSGIRLNHGHGNVLAAIGKNLSGDKNDWQAINYRFLKDGKGWRVFITVSLPEVPRLSVRGAGVIGIDINEHHLSVTETDRFGNPVEYFSVPCVTYGKTADQRNAIIGDAVKSVVAFAQEKRKPLVLEKLDFRKKKAMLEDESPKYARMLSSFAYTMIQTIIRARAFDAGIEIYEVNPACTSVIGQHKFSARYGISVHNAAALVIGRRASGFGETLPSQLQVTLPLPARNRGRHVWSQWAAVSRRAKAAHAARGRSEIIRSRTLPASVVKGGKAWAGTIPSGPVKIRHANRRQNCSGDVLDMMDICP